MPEMGVQRMSVFTNPGSGSKGSANAYIAAILHELGCQDPLQVLGSTPENFAAAIAALSPQQLRTPERSGKWSIQQVLAHMADSEIVWSWRLRMVLAHDRPALTSFDQDLWAERLGYVDVDADQSLRVFTVLRAGNLRLLGRAGPEDLGRVGLHEERGEESVQHMMRLYAGHDIVHTRQIERVRDAVTGSPVLR
jgi:uncharacterized damage-inducible protein DinB